MLHSFSGIVHDTGRTCEGRVRAKALGEVSDVFFLVEISEGIQAKMTSWFCLDRSYFLYC